MEEQEHPIVKPDCPNGCDPKNVMYDNRRSYRRWFCKTCGEPVPQPEPIDLSFSDYPPLDIEGI